MAEKFLNETALTQLINNIQNKTIKSYTYENVLGTVSTEVDPPFLDSSVAFLKITATASQAWKCNVKFSTQNPNDDNSLQIVDATLIGIENNLVSWETSNVIYDIAHQRALNLAIINDFTNLYIGLHYDPLIGETHNVIMEIKEKSNCSLTIFKNPKRFTQDDGVAYNTIDITQNGIHSQALNEVKDNLASVAITGSYNDLTDKPSLLNVIEDETNENLIFSYN